MIRNFRSGGDRAKYMIALNVRRSRIALLACDVTLFATLFAIYGGLSEYAKDGEELKGLFQFFTSNANIITALAAGFILPFAVEGMRKKHFTYPKWLALFHYSGTICTTITMVVAVFLISWFDPHMAFGGNNLFLHIICPVTVLVSFFLVESDYEYSPRDSLLCLVPFFAYCMIYFFNVVILGPENGGWPDFYHFTDLVPVWVSLPGILLLGSGITAVIRRVSNWKIRLRKKRLTAKWSDDTDPVAVRIEIYGLGRYTGKHVDKNNISLPMDIIELVADRYGMKTDDLLRVFVKGVAEGLKEREK